LKPFREHVEVSAEREYARHLGYRVLDQAADLLMQGRSGSIHISVVPDPEFSAIASQSLHIIAMAVKHDHIPLSFIASVTCDCRVTDNQFLPTPTGIDITNSPEGKSFEADIKENHNEQ
jgi:hypothetical protein